MGFLSACVHVHGLSQKCVLAPQAALEHVRVRVHKRNENAHACAYLADKESEFTRVDQPIVILIKLTKSRRDVVRCHAVLSKHLAHKRLQFEELALLPDLLEIGADRRERHREEEDACRLG